MEKTLTEKEFTLILEAIEVWEKQIPKGGALLINTEAENLNTQEEINDFITKEITKEFEKFKKRKYPALVLKNKIYKIWDKIWTISVLSVDKNEMKLNEYEILDEALDLIDEPISDVNDDVDLDDPVLNKAEVFIKNLTKEDLVQMYKKYLEKKKIIVIEKKKIITELRVKLIEFRNDAEEEAEKAILMKINDIIKS